VHDPTPAHTLDTPAVPATRNPASRELVQKHVVFTVGMFGGLHFPWTSYRAPQFEAHAGRTDVNGTIGPSAAWGF